MTKKSTTTYILPAIAGSMGSTKFFQVVMRADELAAIVRAAMDFEEFDSFLISEKMQRALSEERVEKQIVPYLTNSPDRFFGSMIVLVYEPDQFEFEELSSFDVDFGAYQGSANRMGFLTVGGGKLFALDGQHRLHALRTVVTRDRTPRLNLKIEGPYRNDVASDTLSVIFVEFESIEKARRIFNKVNRYAKPTTKATNILMSEDDGLAIIARCLASLDDPQKFDSMTKPPIPEKMSNRHGTVNHHKASLVRNDGHLFTLEVIYKSVAAITSATGFSPMDEASTIVRPDDEVLRAAYEECAKWWIALVGQFHAFKAALTTPGLISEMRDFDGFYSLALRPIGQEALIAGLMKAHELSGEKPEVLIDAANKIPWDFEDSLWHGVFLGGGEKRFRIITRNTRLGTDLITYMLVGPELFGAVATTQLLNDFRAVKSEYGIDKRALPKPVR